MDNSKISREEFKKILVDLEDEHEHLKATIGRLRHEVEKREIEVQNLVVQRELRFAREASGDIIVDNKLTNYHSNKIKLTSDGDFHQPIDNLYLATKTTNIDSSTRPKSFINHIAPTEYSSNFSKQVARLLDNLTRTSEDINKLLQ